MGEPAFIPKPGAVDEDDAVLMNLSFDPTTMKSSITIYDCKALSKGPICRIPLKGHVPFSFHCSFMDYYGPN